jgi:hypothetical protein
MAIYHFAATFDVNLFHRELVQETVEDDKVNLTKLLNLAKSKVVRSSNSLSNILNIIRYDNDWLTDPDKDQSQAYLWYTICLADFLEISPSLSNNRFHGSHYVLENLLPLAKWSQKDIRELIHGKPLIDLLVNTEYVQFAQLLTLHGGVLGNSDIQDKIEQMKLSVNYIYLNKHNFNDRLIKFAEYNNIKLEDMIDFALQDTIDMLQSATNTNSALYLLRSI